MSLLFNSLFKIFKHLLTIPISFLLSDEFNQQNNASKSSKNTNNSSNQLKNHSATLIANLAEQIVEPTDLFATKILFKRLLDLLILLVIISIGIILQLSIVID